jgi:hypothetical protein
LAFSSGEFAVVFNNSEKNTISPTTDLFSNFEDEKFGWTNTRTRPPM